MARIHPGNTSRKNVHDAWWQPVPMEEVTTLMGHEWSEHWAVYFVQYRRRLLNLMHASADELRTLLC